MNFDFIRVNAMPFYLSPLALARFTHSQLKSFRQALNLFKTKKIDAVISFGGFTSMGFVLAAKVKKIPVILHESNIIPGKATRVLAGFANKILLPQNIFLRKYNKKVAHVDYPIRREFVNISQAEARDQLGWPALKRIILIIGGSNGALALNKWAQQNFPKFAHRNVDIFCIAGPSFSEERAINFEDCTLHMLPFCNHMNRALRACDLVIARAGAGTIAECRYCKKPMILVPYPLAADNHQWANAKIAEELGIATIVDQDEIKTAPIKAEAGKSHAWLFPIKRRTMRGAMRPIRLMSPAKDTTIAAQKEQTSILKSRSLPTLTPRLNALSSPLSRALYFQRLRKKRLEERMAAQAKILTSRQPFRPRSPKVQNMSWVSCTSLEKYWMSVVAPENIALIATPARSIASGLMRTKRDSARI